MNLLEMCYDIEQLQKQERKECFYPYLVKLYLQLRMIGS